MPKQHIHQSVWDGKLLHSGHYDKIMVQNLQVTVNAGTDVWSRKKAQPALISITVTPAKQFASASSTDTVDNSTVHYGTLSKAVQARLQERNSTWLQMASISDEIYNTVLDVADQTPVYAIETSICLPKASMFGDAIVHTISRTCNHIFDDSSVLHLRNIRIPCVIGVNSNERLQKQPVVVNLWVECMHPQRIDDYAQLETLLFNTISETSYQTIETLLSFVVDELKQKFFTKEKDENAWIRLRIEKPLAVPFADAPAVEITRKVRDDQKQF